MGLELIIFVLAILFGILLYWRESNSNKLYRFLNKIVNSKELQMKADDKTGFVYQQKLLLRIVYITLLFIIAMVLLKFLIPINYTTISVFVSCIIGAISGTYLANFVLKSTKIIEEQSESITSKVEETIEKGKEFIDDITSKDSKPEVETPTEQQASKPEQKSARERLKDKGLM